MKNVTKKNGWSLRSQAAAMQEEEISHHTNIPFVELDNSKLKTSAQGDKSVYSLQMLLRQQMRRALTLQKNATGAERYLYDEIIRTVQEIHLNLESCKTLGRNDRETLNQEIAMARRLLKNSGKKITWLSDVVDSRQDKRPRQRGRWKRIPRFLIERGAAKEHSSQTAGDC